MSIKETLREEVSYFEVELNDKEYEVIVSHEYAAQSNELNTENISVLLDGEDITSSGLGASVLAYFADEHG